MEATEGEIRVKRTRSGLVSVQALLDPCDAGNLVARLLASASHGITGAPSKNHLIFDTVGDERLYGILPEVSATAALVEPGERLLILPAEPIVSSEQETEGVDTATGLPLPLDDDSSGSDASLDDDDDDPSEDELDVREPLNLLSDDAVRSIRAARSAADLMPPMLYDRPAASEAGMPHHPIVGDAGSTPGITLTAHLSLTRRTDELRLVWVSNVSGGVPTVTASQGGSPQQQFTGSSSTYTIDDLCAAPANEPANFEAPGQINTVTMTGLTPGLPVQFSYGTSADGFKSSTSRFASPKNLVILADMGRASESITMLENEMNETDLVLFPGDLSYAMGRKGLWAEWFELVEPVFSKIPAFFSCGNHDVLQLQGAERFWPSWGSYELDTGTQGECGWPFQALVAMDGEDENGNRAVNNNWTSLDLPGVAHVVSMSSEHNFTAGSRQAEWLLRDLASVNRTETPWLVVQLHRPMYDSTFNALLPEEAATRTILEPVFEAAGVDLVLTAHVHDYQSMHCRIYNGTCRGESGLLGQRHSVRGSSRAATGPVGRPIMVVGGGGKTSGIRAWMDEPDWLAARTDNLGYARFRPANGTSALWQWVFNTNGTVFDSHWIERPVVSAAREALEAGDAAAPAAGTSAAGLEAWRRERFRQWWRAGAADPLARQDAGLAHPDAAAVAARGRDLAEQDGHVLDPERLMALWQE